VGVAEQTDFIYDGQDIVLALDGEGSLTNRYLHGPAIDQILADEQIAEEQLLWLLADNLGSVRDLVNNAGEVESHIDYTAFGAVETITNNLVQTLYGFTGRERDAETGLTYHRARYYDPLVGRWLSEDPIGFSAGDGNLGRYVGNDPINYTDSTGLQPDAIDTLSKQLGGGKDQADDPAMTGVFTWTNREGKTLNGKVISIDQGKGTVVLEKEDGTRVSVKKSTLKDEDQALIDAINKKPKNVIVDGSAIANDKDRQDWERKVYKDLEDLAGTKAGGELMTEISSVAQPQTILAGGKRVSADPVNKTRVTIVPRSKDAADNQTNIEPGDRRQKATKVTIQYDPSDTKGDLVEPQGGSRRRPPYIGLAKELHVAWSSLNGFPRPSTDWLEWSSRVFENNVRDEVGLPRARVPPKPRTRF
jgi:RHS repeat-associated protein